MSGFNFGNTTPAAPGFSFGTNPTTTMGAPSNISFGITGTPAPAAQAPTSIGFGAAPAFGASTSTQQSVTFGATTTSIGQPPPPAFGATAPTFGATPASTATGFGGFGTKPLGTSFGANTTPFGAQTTGLTTSTAAVATVQPTLSFGAAPVASVAPSTSFNFSAQQPATAAATGGLTFGTSTPATSIAAVSAQPAFGGFGTVVTTSAPAAAPTLGGGFFTARPATTVPNLFGAAAPTIGTSVAPFGGPLTATTTTVPPIKLGLGGIDVNATQPKPNEGHTDITRCKETQLPQEIGITVDALKQHIKQQKSISSDIARTYIPKLFNVSNDLQTFNWSLSEIANCVETNQLAVKSLRSDTSNAIFEAEMARRTQETPSGLQMENTAPLQYFIKLIQKYESDMITLRNQVELIEKHMGQLSSPQNLSADDLKKGLQQIYESFVALAGRVHEIHQKVELQKEQYLNLRKHLLKDRTNVFADDQPTAKINNHLSACGPTPFSQMFNTSNLSMTNRLNAATWPSATSNIGTVTGSGGGGGGGGGTSSTFGGFGVNQSGFGNGGGVLSNTGTNTTNNNLLLFGSSNTFSNSGFGGDGTFNLQKPPLGTKRNKQ